MATIRLGAASLSQYQFCVRKFFLLSAAGIHRFHQMSCTVDRRNLGVRMHIYIILVVETFRALQDELGTAFDKSEAKRS